MVLQPSGFVVLFREKRRLQHRGLVQGQWGSGGGPQVHSWTKPKLSGGVGPGAGGVADTPGGVLAGSQTPQKKRTRARAEKDCLSE